MSKVSDQPEEKEQPAKEQDKHIESIDSKSTGDWTMYTRQFLGGISMLGVWGMLIYQLQTTWNLNDQYAHGYLVPILCLFLAAKAQDPNGDIQDQDSKRGRAWLYLGVPSILLLFPKLLASTYNVSC